MPRIEEVFVFNIVASFCTIAFSNLTHYKTFWKYMSYKNHVCPSGFRVMAPDSQTDYERIYGRTDGHTWCLKDTRDAFSKGHAICWSNIRLEKQRLRPQVCKNWRQYRNQTLSFNSRHLRHLIPAQQKMQHLRISWKNQCIWRLNFCQIIKYCSSFRMNQKRFILLSIDLWRQKMVELWFCPIPLKRDNL